MSSFIDANWINNPLDNDAALINRFEQHSKTYEQRCDKDGVPTICQNWVYLPGSMCFYLKLVTGCAVKVVCEYACPSIDLMQRRMTREQEAEATRNMDALAKSGAFNNHMSKVS